MRCLGPFHFSSKSSFLISYTHINNKLLSMFNFILYLYFKEMTVFW
uniref:Uncharacterized protein n=1 Tax=Anguilla anguilla TaxID=7936 RepID=A0A0E9THA7_ANGAN